MAKAQLHRVIAINVAVLGSLLLLGLYLVAGGAPNSASAVAQPIPTVHQHRVLQSISSGSEPTSGSESISGSISSESVSGSGSSSNSISGSGSGSSSSGGHDDPLHGLPVSLFAATCTLALGAFIKQLFTGIPLPYTALLLGVGMVFGGVLLAINEASWSSDVLIIQRVSE